MKAVIQRVKGAELSVQGNVVASIGNGLVVYFCVEQGDGEELCKAFAAKLCKLRIFADSVGKMNLSVADVGGQVLFVSQFTLAADLSCGNRPSFFGAEKPDEANRKYLLTAQLIRESGVPVQTGIFGADMQITQQNDGPVTIIWEAK